MQRVLRGSTAAALIALAAMLTAQSEGGLIKKALAPIQPPAGPLTLSELYACVEKVEKAVRRVVLQDSRAVPPRTVSEDRPAKRSEIVAEFSRMFNMARPRFKFTPRFVKYDPKVLSFPVGDPARQKVEELIKYGCVGRISPLSTAPVPTMSLEDFGDAIGFFMARLGDLTHTPSAKWSPYMFGHKDAPP